MGRVPCDDIAGENFECEKLPYFRSTNDTLVVTNISIALQNVGPIAQCP